MHVNKVDHVTTVDRVADHLGESVDLIHDVALEMDAEDGAIWVYGVGDDGVLAFTDLGIETLIELIEIHKDSKSRADRWLGRSSTRPHCGLRRMATLHRRDRRLLSQTMSPEPSPLASR